MSLATFSWHINRGLIDAILGLLRLNSKQKIQIAVILCALQPGKKTDYRECC